MKLVGFSKRRCSSNSHAMKVLVGSYECRRGLHLREQTLQYVAAVWKYSIYVPKTSNSSAARMLDPTRSKRMQGFCVYRADKLAHLPIQRVTSLANNTLLSLSLTRPAQEPPSSSSTSSHKAQQINEKVFAYTGGSAIPATLCRRL